MPNPFPVRSAADTMEQPLKGRSGGKVDAPGKKHRKPPANTRGVKHSDEMVAKLKVAEKKLGKSRNRG
jgi:hypothetical protein